MSAAIKHSPTREVFTIDRQMEFFTETELVKQIGYDRQFWHAAIVSELIDNALDHCEEAGILPFIAVTLEDDAIIVSDNGRGIPPGIVASMVDFKSRTSSRMCYAGPTRGRQGNAGKCLIALPFVFNGKIGSVEIVAAGVLHRITTKMDQIARMPVIEHVTETGKVQIGTSVRVNLPCKVGWSMVPRIVLMLQEYAAFNPHAEFTFSNFGSISDYQRTSQVIQKWTAKNPDPAHWYDLPTFENLIAACIQIDRQSGNSRSVRDFVRQFAGCKRSDTLKRVLDATGLARCNLASLVSCNEIDRKQASAILQSMKSETEPPKPLKLGSIGREHIQVVWGYPCEYKRIQGNTRKGFPFVVEAAFCERNDDAGLELFSGVNFSVDVQAPSYDQTWRIIESCKIDDDSPVNLLIHITTPRVQYTNHGKTAITACEELSSAIEKALRGVTKDYTAKRRAVENGVRREKKIPKPKDIFLKDAIFQVMEESIDAVSQGGKCSFDARSHYYRIRPMVQRFTDKELKQKYLDSVIDEWEELHGIIELRQRDPRGFLLEPHTGKRIPLGTAQVDQYTIPLHLYHTIIYVEKKGLLPIFQYGKIGEKYDAAIICAEGYAVRASQQLMQSANSDHDMKIFVLHDADPYGYSISNAIGQKSGARKFNYEVIDAGLRIQEAIEMGLETEEFSTWKCLPKSIEFTDYEREIFSGRKQRAIRKNGKEGFRYVGCKRVELNALSANPQRFVEWVEMKLDQHGAGKKYVPADDVIESKVSATYHDQRRSSIRSAVMNSLDVESIVTNIDSNLHVPSFAGVADTIKQWATKLEPLLWSTVCEGIAEKRLTELHEEIDTAAAKVAKRLNLEAGRDE